jgi:uncharacterized protein (TIGR02996 family)
MDAMAKVDTLLAAANGRRRTMLLTRDDVMEAVADARASPHGIGVRHGGKKLLAWTTLCLAVKVARGVVVGIAVIKADRPSPGNVWKEVQPWRQDVTKNVDKARAWAARAGRDRVLIGGKAPATAAVGAKPRATRARGDGDALLARVLADPRDLATRRIYADHLVEQGDPRGELIHVQLGLAEAKTPAQKRALSMRERALLRKHGNVWMKSALQDAKECTIARGFVASVRMTGAAWANKGARLFERDPIEELIVSQPNANALAAIAGARHTARLAALRTGSTLYLSRARDVAALRAFLDAPAVRAIPAVELRAFVSPGFRDAPTQLATGLAGLVLARGHELSVGADGRSARAIKQLVAALPRVRDGG